MKITYDLILAKRHGVELNPMEQMEKLGFVVLEREYFAKSDTAQFEVENKDIDEKTLPEYLKVE